MWSHRSEERGDIVDTQLQILSQLSRLSMVFLNTDLFTTLRSLIDICQSRRSERYNGTGSMVGIRGD